MTTSGWRARGRDGLVEFDGQILTIKRNHVRGMLAGVLRGASRADVRLTVDQITDVRLGRRRIVVKAPGAVRWTGRRTPSYADERYPLMVKFARPAAADFAGLATALYSAVTATSQRGTPGDATRR
jgi:hypothetical protein